MLKLNFLGRGSAFNIKEGNTSAYIKNGKDFILLDCGEDIFERIINNNLLNDVSNVYAIITHLNSDHVGSLSSLIYYCYYIKKITPNIYFPGAELQQLLNLMGHYKEFNLTLPEVAINFNINNICFKFIQVTHIEKMNCYGIIIKDEDSLIYYSGDSNNISKDILNKLNEIDYIYQDTCLADYRGNPHLALRKLSELIAKEWRSKVYCMHIDNDELITQAREQGFNVVEIN
ncbi:MBL fold metallo-hydrolase [Clostridium lundense]|uniref:MBL fold metallo-hydrolase n=1 Tax=Clostridium lundense TaxID=319475 RepID=UPI000485A0B9|nr:MBL fold metallo-hydrolase [Clostridium lundense]